MFVRIWRFRAAPGKEAEFERFNGSSGDWARLFALGSGYVGTTLTPIPGSPGEYLTFDRWDSSEAWQAFRRDFAEAYERLDREAEGLTSSEVPVFEGDSRTIQLLDRETRDST
jgi:heme-degrading monooxygenase HmoA